MPDLGDLEHDDVIRTRRQPYGTDAPRADPPGRRGPPPTPVDLPPPTHTPQWRDLAACKGQPVHWWYPEGGVTSANIADLNRARDVCRACPVDVECLTHGVVWPEVFGAWGGYTAKHVARFRKVTKAPQPWRLEAPTVHPRATAGTAA